MTTPNPTVPAESTQPLQSTTPEETSSTSGTTPATPPPAAEANKALRPVTELSTAVYEAAKRGKVNESGTDKQTYTKFLIDTAKLNYDGNEQQITEQVNIGIKNYEKYLAESNLQSFKTEPSFTQKIAAFGNDLVEKMSGRRGEDVQALTNGAMLLPPFTAFGLAAQILTKGTSLNDSLDAVSNFLLGTEEGSINLSDTAQAALKSAAGVPTAEQTNTTQFKTEQAKQNRLSEQAALMLTVEDIIKRVSNTGQDPNTSVDPSDLNFYKRLYKNFAAIRYTNPADTPTGHIAVTNNFTKTVGMDNFFKTLPPQILSLLVPSVKLYKTLYPIPNVTLPANAKIDGYDWQIPFDDVPVDFGNQTSEFVAKNIDSILDGHGFFHGVAIKSFSYHYRGTQPAEINSNIEATLELIFQNPEELTKNINFTFSDSRFRKKPSTKQKYQKLSFSYCDLLNQANKSYNGAFNEEYYRIKIVCGYADLQTDTISDILRNIGGFNDAYINNILDAIEASRVTFNLSPYNYNINFNDNGTVGVTINFIASIDTSLITAEADLFSISPKAQELNAAIKAYKTFLELKDKQQNNSNLSEEDAICKSSEDLQKQIKEFKEQNKDFENLDEETFKAKLNNVSIIAYNTIYDYLTGYSLLTGEWSGYNIRPKVYHALLKPDILGVKNEVAGSDVAERIEAIQTGGQLIDVIPMFDDTTIALTRLEDSTDKAGEEALKRADERITKKYSEGQQAYRIKFIFLGDIIDVALECLNQIQPDNETPRVVIGNIPINLPTQIKDRVGNTSIVSDLREVNLNLADIPVSLELFQEFMLEHVVKPKKERYPVLQFIKDIISDLLIPSISPQVFGQSSAINASIRFSTSYFNFNTLDGIDAISGVDVKQKTFRRTINENVVKELEDPAKRMKLQLEQSKRSSKSASQDVNYVFITCTSRFPKTIISSNADEVKDSKNGVYHIRMGTDAGIVKKINFEKANTPFLREMAARREGNGRGTSIRQVFNATVEMFGNNIFRPGDYVYIHPMYFYGTGGKILDLESKLGVGGYYLVLDVKTDISDGGYKTIIKCAFQAHVQTIGNEKKIKPINEPCSGAK